MPDTTANKKSGTKTGVSTNKSQEQSITTAVVSENNVAKVETMTVKEIYAKIESLNKEVQLSKKFSSVIEKGLQVYDNISRSFLDLTVLQQHPVYMIKKNNGYRYFNLSKEQIGFIQNVDMRLASSHYVETMLY